MEARAEADNEMHKRTAPCIMKKVFAY